MIWLCATKATLFDCVIAEFGAFVDAAVQSSPDVSTMPPSHWAYYHGPLESSILRMYKSPLPHIAPSNNYRAHCVFRSFMKQSFSYCRQIDIISVRPVQAVLSYWRVESNENVD